MEKTMSEVAKCLGVCMETLRKIMCDNNIVPTRLDGNKKLFDEQTVETINQAYDMRVAQREMKHNAIVGQRFDRLLVKRYAGLNNKYEMLYDCVCDCGVEITTTGNRLRTGQTRSCGCLRRDRHREWVAKNAIEHPKSKERLYSIWAGMKQRCYNKKDKAYPNYGWRGIILCDEWKNNYDAFAEWSYNNGYSNNLTIERINVDGNYEPQNCTWITLQEQNKNKQNSLFVEYNGVVQSVGEWSKQTGINKNTLYSRLSYGWSIEKVMSKNIFNKNANLVTYNGRTQTLTAWGRELGFSYAALKYRIQEAGWPIEKAFTTPLETRHYKNE